MPELPDVEGFRKYVEQTSLHREVAEVEVRQPAILENIDPQAFVAALKSKSLTSARRYGKHLLVQIGNDGWLHLHFGMSGFVKAVRKGEQEPSHPRVLLQFIDGTKLIYDNRRMIGKVGIVVSPERLVEERNLGPDALLIDEETFVSRVSASKGKIKQVLMDQSVLAGIGNEYSDELLFQLGIHPEVKVQTVSKESLCNMYVTMERVLATAVESEVHGRSLPSWFFLPHRSAKGSCPRGHGRLSQIKTGGRTAYICKTCQHG